MGGEVYDVTFNDPLRCPDMTTPLEKRIFVAGHRGMVGSAICRRLRSLGYTNLLTAPRSALDLMDQAAVRRFFNENPIDQVYLAAAKVGGIHAITPTPGISSMKT